MDWVSTEECLKFAKGCKEKPQGRRCIAWSKARRAMLDWTAECGRPHISAILTLDEVSAHHEVEKFAGDINLLDDLLACDSGLYFLIKESLFDHELLGGIGG